MINAKMLSSLELFRGLTPEQRAAAAAVMKRRDVLRGHTLVTRGEPSTALFIVLHGVFEVYRGEKVPAPIARVSAGELIGEMGFLADTPRTATVIAIRDAAVLELDRDAYQRLLLEIPSIASALLVALARRLDVSSARLAPDRERATERTAAFVHGGREPLPPVFFERLRAALESAGARVIDSDAVASRFGNRPPNSVEVTEWLSTLEWEHDLLVYLADETLTDWTRKCVRQADLVVLATRGKRPPDALSPTELFVREIHDSDSLRLVRVHDRRAVSVLGTAKWLSRTPVHMHHHVSLQDDADFQRLARFLTGRAVGYVAGGGGGFGPAHIGIHQAFAARGAAFDIYIGTSVGAAMSAGFALGFQPADMDAMTHDIFVARRAFKRPNWPRYALLDHAALDDALADACGRQRQIEDCWNPFIALATNLSNQRLELIRSGSMWKAVRASSAIPAVLPPVYTDDGMMLVDGGVMDNAPLAPLKQIKRGPNLVVHFGRTGLHRFKCRYEDIPTRRDMLKMLLNPFARRQLPGTPGAAGVLMRSLMAHQRYELPVGPHDLVLRPPPFPGSAFLDFDRHTDVLCASRAWAHGILDELERSGDRALLAIMTA